MPSQVSQTLNRPILASVSGADAVGGILHLAAINVPLAYEQELWVDGFLANFRLVDPAQTGPRLMLLGLDNVELRGITVAGNIFQFRDAGKLTYHYDQWLVGSTHRVYEVFESPLRLSGSPVYSFGFGATTAGAAAAGWDLDLQVMARIVRKDQKDFPLAYR
jgi:hypothetical protein